MVNSAALLHEDCVSVISPLLLLFCVTMTDPFVWQLLRIWKEADQPAPDERLLPRDCYPGRWSPLQLWRLETVSPPGVRTAYDHLNPPTPGPDRFINDVETGLCLRQYYLWQLLCSYGYIVDISHVNVTRAFGRFIWKEKEWLPPLHEEETAGRPEMDTPIQEPKPPFPFLEFVCPFPEYRRQALDKTYKMGNGGAPEDLMREYVGRG